MANLTRVVSSGPGYTVVEDDAGNQYTVKGNVAWRANNPGNLRPGSLTNNLGAIGVTDTGGNGKFLVFPDYATGVKAQAALQFETPKYANKTISEAIHTYAPKGDNNNPKAYAQRLADAVGVSVDTKLSELSPTQRQAYIAAQHKVENNRPGKISGDNSETIANLFYRPGSSNALSAINSLVPEPSSSVASAYFKPLPAPAPLVPQRINTQPTSFNLNPPNLPLNTPIPANRGGYYGSETDRWAPTVGTLGIQPVPNNGLSASGTARAGTGVNSQVSLGGSRPSAPVSLSEPGFTYTASGFGGNQTDFQRNNQDALLNVLGALGLQQSPNAISRGAALAPKASVPVAVAKPASVASLGSALAGGAIKAGTGIAGSAALKGNPFAGASAGISPRIAVPTVPVPKPYSPTAIPLTKFNTVNPGSQIIPRVQSGFTSSPIGHLFDFAHGNPVQGGILGLLQGAMQPRVAATPVPIPQPYIMPAPVGQQFNYDQYARDTFGNPNGGAHGGSLAGF